MRGGYGDGGRGVQGLSKGTTNINKNGDQVTASTHSLMSLATRGAAELDGEAAAKSIPLPESTYELLRRGTKMAAGASMWSDKVYHCTGHSVKRLLGSRAFNFGSRPISLA